VTSEQWAKVNDLFHEALERPAGERHAWLAAATGGDADVLREVEALIAAHEREPEFLDAPAALSGAPMTDGPSLVGRRIGAYAITREIGRGGMGVVYLAHDTRLGRDVAIKALPRDLSGVSVSAGGRRRERLRREARAAAALTHPNIATIYALEEDGDELYLVSEYVRGSTLREEVAAGPLMPARLIETAIEITRAIGAAHAEGIIHRDLKPDNVMRTSSGSIKILDFGLARATMPWGDEDLAPTLTRSGALLGTPAYMAPEQIRGHRADARVDLFAAGVMFYELASGIHPFDGTAVGLTLHRILTETPLPFAAHGVLTPPGLWPVVERLLEKEPESRYARADELLADLLRVQAMLEGGVGAASVAESGRLASAAGSSHEAARTPTADTARAGVVFSNATITTESAARSSEWWWRFHQLAVAVVLAAAVGPAWQTWAWIPQDALRGLLRVTTLVVVALGVSLRLHLWFLSRYDPTGLMEQLPRASPWVRVADGGFSLAVLTGALTIMPEHSGIGAMFLGFGIIYAVVFLMIEPATTRAAFRER
jgi:serine/threonine protein kinase